MNDESNKSEFDKELMQAFQALSPVPAPQHLHEKLMRIPEQFERQDQSRRRHVRFFDKKFVSLVAAGAAAILMYVNLPEKEQVYSPEEVAAAQRQLALAFNYVSKYSTNTATEINDLVADTSTGAIYQAMFYSLAEEDQSN